MRVLHVVAETPVSFLQHLKDITYIERRPLKFCAERLTSLVRTLELTRIDEYSALQKVAAFATLVATYEKGERESASIFLHFEYSLNVPLSSRRRTQSAYRLLAHSRTLRD